MRVQEETAALVRFDREQDVTNPERVAHGQLERPEGQAFYTLRSGFDHIEAPSSNSGAQGMLSISRRSVAGERVVCEEPNCKITSEAALIRGPWC